MLSSHKNFPLPLVGPASWDPLVESIASFSLLLVSIALERSGLFLWPFVIKSVKNSADSLCEERPRSF